MVSRNLDRSRFKVFVQSRFRDDRSSSSSSYSRDDASVNCRITVLTGRTKANGIIVIFGQIMFLVKNSFRFLQTVLRVRFANAC